MKKIFIVVIVNVLLITFLSIYYGKENERYDLIKKEVENKSHILSASLQGNLFRNKIALYNAYQRKQPDCLATIKKHDALLNNAVKLMQEGVITPEAVVAAVTQYTELTFHDVIRQYTKAIYPHITEVLHPVLIIKRQSNDSRNYPYVHYSNLILENIENGVINQGLFTFNSGTLFSDYDRRLPELSTEKIHKTISQLGYPITPGAIIRSINKNQYTWLDNIDLSKIHFDYSFTMLMYNNSIYLPLFSVLSQKQDLELLKFLHKNKLNFNPYSFANLSDIILEDFRFIFWHSDQQEKNKQQGKSIFELPEDRNRDIQKAIEILSWLALIDVYPSDEMKKEILSWKKYDNNDYQALFNWLVSYKKNDNLEKKQSVFNQEILLAKKQLGIMNKQKYDASIFYDCFYEVQKINSRKEILEGASRMHVSNLRNKGKNIGHKNMEKILSEAHGKIVAKYRYSKLYKDREKSFYHTANQIRSNIPISVEILAIANDLIANKKNEYLKSQVNKDKILASLFKLLIFNNPENADKHMMTLLNAGMDKNKIISAFIKNLYLIDDKSKGKQLNHNISMTPKVSLPLSFYKVLLNNDIDLTLTDSIGYNSFYRAIVYDKNLALAKFLYNNGVSAISDPLLDNPLEAVLLERYNLDYEVIDYLRSIGLKNRYEKTITNHTLARVKETIISHNTNKKQLCHDFSKNMQPLIDKSIQLMNDDSIKSEYVVEALSENNKKLKFYLLWKYAINKENMGKTYHPMLYTRGFDLSKKVFGGRSSSLKKYFKEIKELNIDNRIVLPGINLYGKYYMSYEKNLFLDFLKQNKIKFNLTFLKEFTPYGYYITNETNNDIRYKKVISYPQIEETINQHLPGNDFSEIHLFPEFSYDLERNKKYSFKGNYNSAFSLESNAYSLVIASESLEVLKQLYQQGLNLNPYSNVNFSDYFLNALVIRPNKKNRDILNWLLENKLLPSKRKTNLLKRKIVHAIRNINRGQYSDLTKDYEKVMELLNSITYFNEDVWRDIKVSDDYKNVVEILNLNKWKDTLKNSVCNMKDVFNYEYSYYLPYEDPYYSGGLYFNYLEPWIQNKIAYVKEQSAIEKELSSISGVFVAMKRFYESGFQKKDYINISHSNPLRDTVYKDLNTIDNLSDAVKNNQVSLAQINQLSILTPLMHMYFNQVTDDKKLILDKLVRLGVDKQLIERGLVKIMNFHQVDMPYQEISNYTINKYQDNYLQLIKKRMSRNNSHALRYFKKRIFINHSHALRHSTAFYKKAHELGLDLNLVDDIGYNSFYRAIVRDRNLELAKFLYDSGVPAVSDPLLDNPLEAALLDPTVGTPEVIDYLKSIGLTDRHAEKTINL